MAFEGLTEKLSAAFKKLRGKGRLSESDVKEAMREIRLALLEADVSYKVVKDFIKKTTERAVGADVLDGSGKAHLGIIMFPVPILRGDAEQIRAIRETLYGVDYQDVIVVDFSDVAQCCKNYGEYIGNAAQADESEWRYFGLGLCGPKKLVSRLTGSMPLLR